MNTVVVISYFIIYSFFGWILESVYKTAHQKEFINSGFLAGPFCPIYGFGALIMYISLKDFTDNIVVLFLFGTIALSIFEYIVGLFLEIVFKTKYWDYSNYKFNIQGRVCLKNSLYWGILGIVFMRVIHPFVEKTIQKIPHIYLIAFLLIGSIYLLIDTITTIVKLVRINIKLTDLENIGEEIKNKIEDIKVRTAINYTNMKNIQRVHRYHSLRKFAEAKKYFSAITTLHEKQRENIERLEKKIKRLRKAFPSMKSEKLSKLLNNGKNS